ncbi:MAG: hypothetical protein IJK28_02315 [Clostridia bacterium]|nr:hypothetical protein [Clostridia bacterium]
MKRLFALLMTLCLTAAAILTAAAEDVLILDAFDVRPDPAYVWQTAPLVHNAVVLTGTPAGDEEAGPVLQVRWRAEPLLTDGMTEAAVPFWADWHTQFTERDFGSRGFEDAACELADAGLITADGRLMLCVTYALTVGGETCFRSDALAGSVWGYWIFSAEAPDAAQARNRLQTLLDGVTWTQDLYY